ncbi:MAG: TRAP transporter small permease subunit [Pseudooceanicola nanhaiensis]
MKTAILTLHAWNTRLVKWAAIVAGIATFVIMWVIDINAVSRKFLNAPLPAGVELTQSLLPVVVMLPFAWALATRHHVSSAFVTSRLSPETRRWLWVFWMIVGCVLFAFVTYGTWAYALRSYHMGEQVWGATLRFPLWPSKMAVSLGTCLVCIQFGLEALRGMVTPASEDPHVEMDLHA